MRKQVLQPSKKVGQKANFDHHPASEVEWPHLRIVGWEHLRQQVATQDLKIACIRLAHDASLLTRNITDFKSVPGLRVENWLD